MSFLVLILDSEYHLKDSNGPYMCLSTAMKVMPCTLGWLFFSFVLGTGGFS